MLNFPDESSIRTGWESDLKKVLVAKDGTPQIADRSTIFRYYKSVMIEVKQSKSATSILAYVICSRTKIHVVGMIGGGFSCFNSDYPRKGEGTIYYSLTAEMSIGFTSTGPHDVASETDLDRTTAHPRHKTPMGMRREPIESQSLPNWVGFLHEVGHAKQFIDNPSFFDGSYANSTDLQDEIQQAALNRKAFWATAKSKDYQAIG